MKSGLNMVQDIYSLIAVGDVKSIISGNCYQYERPLNSVLEDIVVNSLALTGHQIQDGVANVNIHIPNLTNVVIDGVNDSTQPDIRRFNQVSGVVNNLIKDFNGPDFHASISQPGSLIRDVNGQWYMNIRVDYFSVQNKFTFI